MDWDFLIVPDSKLIGYIVCDHRLFCWYEFINTSKEVNNLL